MEEQSKYEVVAKAEPVTPMSMLNMAVSQGADLDKLERLMALQERWEANEAQKAYVRAMAAFKENPPTVLKDKTASFTTQNGKGRTTYKYANLAGVATAIGKELSKHGLSAAWKTEQTSKITVTCTITHEMGHSESCSLSAEADQTGNKNAIQAVGSTISYLQKYTLLSLAGLAADDQDDDGASASTTGEPSAAEKWHVSFTEAKEAGKETLTAWWNKNMKAIEAEIGKAATAKIYKQVAEALK